MSALFSAMRIKGVEFRNRVVMPPMVRLVRSMPDEVADTDGGRVTEPVVEHYRRRAGAGTGLIIVEATAVDGTGRCWRHGLNAYDDSHVPGLARIAAAVRSEGAVASIQMLHGGPGASPDLNGRPAAGPSALSLSPDSPPLRELSVGEIQAIEQRFEDAAARAIEAGFDAVELHGAHGFLLDSFLSKLRNRRTDSYGGTLAGRMRFLVETCGKVRSRIGGGALLACRISIFNKLAEGFEAPDLAELVRCLEHAGLDVLHISTDGAFKGYFGADKTVGQLARESTALPTIVCGGLGDPRDAERIVAEGHADFAAVGNAMLKDPDWTLHARQTLAAQPCVQEPTAR